MNVEANKEKVAQITGKMNGQYEQMMKTEGFNKIVTKKRNNNSEKAF